MNDHTSRDALAVRASRRKVVIGGLLLAGAGGAALLMPRAATPPTPAGTLDRVLPLAFGAYRSTSANSLILPPASDLRESTYSDTVFRGYTAPDVSIYLLAACGAASEVGLTIHRPEDCYPAFGFAVSIPRRVALGAGMPPGVEGSFFTAHRGDRIEHVLYWVRIGSVFPASQWDQRLAIARANLGGVLPAGILLRLSVFGGGAERALSKMTQFNAELLAAGGIAGREVLLGKA